MWGKSLHLQKFSKITLYKDCGNTNRLNEITVNL